jgi:hypothetical protein
MNHEQTPGSYPAQNETKKISLENKSEKKLRNNLRIIAGGQLAIAALTGFTAIHEHSDAVSYQNGAVIKEQQQNHEGAMDDALYAHEKEQGRNLHMGMTALNLALSGGAFALLGAMNQNRRTKEVIISGEKPTEQPKE